MSYSNGIQITYKFAAFAGISAAGQSSEKIVGPAGKTGRIVAMVGVVTTANTTAIGGITLRDNVTTTTVFATMACPIQAAELALSAPVIDGVGADFRIPAGTVLELDGDGLGTAGVADVYVTIEWS